MVSKHITSADINWHGSRLIIFYQWPYKHLPVPLKTYLLLFVFRPYDDVVQKTHVIISNFQLWLQRSCHIVAIISRYQCTPSTTLFTYRWDKFLGRNSFFCCIKFGHSDIYWIQLRCLRPEDSDAQAAQTERILGS